MKVLITGGNGQLGWELQYVHARQCADGGGPVAGDRVRACDLETLDIRDPQAVQTVLQAWRPDVVINAAAYTAVDRAESEVALAEAVNTHAAGNLARAVAGIGARMIHVSTDFVFDGTASVPYRPEAQVSPLNVYGRTKQAGEQLVLEILGDRATVVRTSWLYSRHGQNFVRTVLRLAATREQVGIVCDQTGTPTWARTLAHAIWRLVHQPEYHGLWHWSDAGTASWYDFAVAITEEARQAGHLALPVAHIRPIGTEEYPTPARRPAYSVLDCRASWRALQMEPLHWRLALRQMFADWEQQG
jgi:dTDP-4-dehydrorhamnose reductase